jgi:hypothetical protein
MGVEQNIKPVTALPHYTIVHRFFRYPENVKGHRSLRYPILKEINRGVPSI